MALQAIYIRALSGASAGDKTQGILQAGQLQLPCALGRAGISAFKREGDGATPRAILHIAGGYYRRALPPAAPQWLRLRRARPQDGWCDAAGDRNYNHPVRLPYSASAESLRRPDCLYDICLILDWNMRPRIKGRGSAVFMHLARPAESEAAGAEGRKGSSASAFRHGLKRETIKPTKWVSLFCPTAGCIALREGDMRRLLPHLSPATKIVIL